MFGASIAAPLATPTTVASPAAARDILGVRVGREDRRPRSRRSPRARVPQRRGQRVDQFRDRQLNADRARRRDEHLGRSRNRCADAAARGRGKDRLAPCVPVHAFALPLLTTTARTLRPEEIATTTGRGQPLLRSS